MQTLRAWCSLVQFSFGRLTWSTGTLMVLLPLVTCTLFPLRGGWHNASNPLQGFNRFSTFVIVVFASLVVPIVALAFGTAGLGAEREDRTLVFLLVRPLPRPLILLAKLAASLPLILALCVGSFWVYCLLAGAPGELAFERYVGGVVLITLAYTGLFHLFAVLFRHATIVAVIYALFIEGLLGNMPGMIKRVAINYYGRSLLYAAGAPDGVRAPDPRWFEPIAPATATWALAVIGVVSLSAAMIIFTRREYRDLA